jgi:hypothetical protein
MIKEQEKRKFLREEEGKVFIEDIENSQLIELGSVTMSNGYKTSQFILHPTKVEEYVGLKFSDMFFMTILHLRQKGMIVRGLRRSVLIKEFGFSHGAINRTHKRLVDAKLIEISKTFDNNTIYEIINKDLFNNHYCDRITPYLLLNKNLSPEHKGFILKIWEHILEDIYDHVSYGIEKLALIIGSTKPTVKKYIGELKALGYIESRDVGFNISKKRLLFDLEKFALDYAKNVM